MVVVLLLSSTPPFATVVVAIILGLLFIFFPFKSLFLCPIPLFDQELFAYIALGCFQEAS